MTWRKLATQEKANVLTHLVGLLLMIITAPIFLSIIYGKVASDIFYSLLIFFLSAITVYLSSTIYHLVQNPIRKKIWRKIDHIAIYFLIGGTYQPFVMLNYGGNNGALFMTIMWLLIAMGTLYKIFIKKSWGWVSTVIYLSLGWMVVFIFEPVLNSISVTSLVWLLIGGAAYTGGVFFYKMKVIPYNHAIWHVCVLFGTVSHFISISVDVFN